MNERHIVVANWAELKQYIVVANWAELKQSVVFQISDVETTCEQLAAAGVPITMMPMPMGWGMFAKFVDPEGNEFGMTSQPLA